MSTYRAPVEAGQVQNVAGMSRQMKLSELLRAATGGLSNDVGTFTSDGQNFVPNYGAMIKPVTDTATAYFAGQEKDAADASMQQAFQEYADVGRGDFAQGMGPLADRSNVVATPQWKMDAARDKLMVNPDIMANETYAPIILKSALERGDPTKSVQYAQGPGGSVFDPSKGTYAIDPVGAGRVDQLLDVKQDDKMSVFEKRREMAQALIDQRAAHTKRMAELRQQYTENNLAAKQGNTEYNNDVRFDRGIAKEDYLGGYGPKPTAQRQSSTAQAGDIPISEYPTFTTEDGKTLGPGGYGYMDALHAYNQSLKGQADQEASAPTTAEPIYPQRPTKLEEQKALAQSKEDIKTATTKTKKEEGQKWVNSTVDDLINQHNTLTKLGGSVSESNKGIAGTISNALNAAAVKDPFGIPNAVGSITGNDEQVIRQDIKQRYNILLRDIVGVTGISASQMNSDRELQQVKALVNDPKATVESQISALQALRNRYGTPIPNPGAPDLKTKYNLR